MVSLVFFVDILQLPHTIISNSETLTHPTGQVGLGVQGRQGISTGRTWGSAERHAAQGLISRQRTKKADFYTSIL